VYIYVYTKDKHVHFDAKNVDTTLLSLFFGTQSHDQALSAARMRMGHAQLWLCCWKSCGYAAGTAAALLQDLLLQLWFNCCSSLPRLG